MFNEYSPITRLTIADLLTENTAYTIPIYQRGYAWGTPEIEQLIQDVIDYARSSPDKNYYIGTLVVSADQRDIQSSFITIDGQQRLTTLFILHAVLQHDYQSSCERLLRLKFECRPLADHSLAAIADNNLPVDASDYEANILTAYAICEQALCKLSANDMISFMDYLYKKVVIVRVGLRKGTDLNHYFEVMNSRGAQLEKHEVLKARLMGVFNNDAHGARYRTCFDRIWVACSNMDRYVQHGFSKEHRHHLFGYQDWSKLTVESFDDLVLKIHPEEGTIKAATLSLAAILDDKKAVVSLAAQDEDSSERFHAVINFPNFLLHVLQLEVPAENIPLDDNRLLDTFADHTPKEEAASIHFVKSFIFHLLKYRLLFDKYIIKREFSTDGDRWSLKCLRWYSPKGQQDAVRYVNTFENAEGDTAYSDNRRILMLLSMFHVSNPSPSYKHWLYAALRYLSQQQEVQAHAYIAYLENVAREYVIAQIAAPLVPGQLRFGAIRGPLVFNFLDYLLWGKYSYEETRMKYFKDNSIDNRVKYFEYTFRYSTEHYYPQHPVDPAKEIDAAHLHTFGNLCLITHEKNSLLNNKMPNEKKEHYPANKPIDSIKQYLMMQYKDWDVAAIEQHDKAMIALLNAHM